MKGVRILVSSTLVFFITNDGLNAQKPLELYVFRDFHSPVPERMILVGEVQSKSKDHALAAKDKNPEYDTRLDRVTVKLVNRKGLKRGQKLYIIDKDPYHKRFQDGHIVGEIEVISIFYSPFYGWALSGRGILLRIRKGHFVARAVETESLERAFAIKRQGDHYTNQNKIEYALVSYRKALDADISLPEAHAAIGRIYFEKQEHSSPISSLPLEALAAYEQAWRYRKNFRYRQEELDYYHNYMQSLYYSYILTYQEASRGKRLFKYLDRIIEVGLVASRLEKSLSLKTGIGLARAHYYRMLYYSDQLSPEERKHYDHSKKQADTWLKKLLIMDNRKNGELLRISILFYSHRYKELDKPQDLEHSLRKKIGKMILEKLGPYYSLYLDQTKEKRDPQIDQILHEIEQSIKPSKQLQTR